MAKPQSAADRCSAADQREHCAAREFSRDVGELGAVADLDAVELGPALACPGVGGQPLAQ
jgi:hypothetical protein